MSFFTNGMNIQEAKEFFADSDFSAETKKKIAKLLDGKTALDEFTTESIKALMQLELEKDFKEAGVEILHDVEAEETEKEYKADLEKIEKDLTEDQDFVDSELKKLDDIRKRVVKTSEDMTADAIRQSI